MVEPVFTIVPEVKVAETVNAPAMAIVPLLAKVTSLVVLAPLMVKLL